MNINKQIKTSLAVGTLVAFALMGSTALAQDVTESERATTDDLMRAASERLDDEVEDEEEREVHSALEDSADVSLEDYEQQERGLTPEELDQLQRDLQAQNEDMINQLRDIIAGSPHDPQRPEWMFQQAELMWELRHMEYLRERNDYNACLDAAFEGTIEEDECDEPEPDYHEPREIYEAILQEFPDYNRLDEVIFRLGRGLLDADEGPRAVEYLNRLVSNYPNSQYIADAYLSLGDYFFEEHMTGAAKDNYTSVLDYDEYRNYDYALYQLGWTNYNMGEYRDSADRFKEVIGRSEGHASWGLLADRAANDLMLPLANLPDGWLEAREYFIEIRDIEFAYQQLEQMAGHLETQGMDDQAIAVYDWFLDERPNAAGVPDWMDAITRSLREVDFDAYEQRVVEYVDYLHPDGTWYRHNTDEEEALDFAERFVERNLSRLGTHHHRRAQESGEQAQYAQAAEYYQQFIDRFPDHHISFDMTFFLGEIYLHSLERYDEAAEQYQLVVDLYRADNVPEGADEEEVEAFVRDAAYNVVVSYNHLVRAHHPESVLVDMAERAGEDPELTTAGIDEVTDEEGDPEPVEREDLLQWEEGFVRASDQFSEMYPADDITPTVDYVAAEIYRDRGHYDNCIPRYESIIENAPEHTYASFAGNSLLEANYRLEQWDEVERWARHLKEHEIFDVTPRESLTSAIAYAINQRAINLEAADQHEEASSELLRLAEEFPDSDLAPGALFNAAAIYEMGDEVTRAVEIYNRVVDDYPDASQVPEALNVLGLIHEARTDFDRAATYFARLGEEAYRDAEEAADAVLNAAVLREAMEQWDEAISTYEDYLNFFDDRIDDQQEIEYHLAFLEQDRQEYELSRTRLESYLEDYEGQIEPVEQVEIYLELGLLAERLQPDGWEELADEYFTQTIDIWRDEQLWEQEYGEDAQATRRAMRHEPAQARFHQAEVVFRKFQEVELAFPPDNLAEKAQEKAGYQQEAEQMFREIIEMGSPRWVAASSFRIGQSYRDFAEALFNLPIPDDVPPEREFEYQLSVDELALPLQEQALNAFNQALNLALQYEAYNEWSSRSAAEISDLESAAFPITGQDGVEVEHNRVEFFSPSPVTDMGVVRQRGALRWERLKPEPPEPGMDPDMEPGEQPEEQADEAAPQASAIGWTP